MRLRRCASRVRGANLHLAERETGELVEAARRVHRHARLARRRVQLALQVRVVLQLRLDGAVHHVVRRVAPSTAPLHERLGALVQFVGSAHE